MEVDYFGVKDIMQVLLERIKKQLQKDIMTDQITIKEYIDPFKGSKYKKCGCRNQEPFNRLLVASPYRAIPVDIYLVFIKNKLPYSLTTIVFDLILNL